jgi:hypothetical protein
MDSSHPIVIVLRGVSAVFVCHRMWLNKLAKEAQKAETRPPGPQATATTRPRSRPHSHPRIPPPRNLPRDNAFHQAPVAYTFQCVFLLPFLVNLFTTRCLSLRSPELSRANRFLTAGGAPCEVYSVHVSPDSKRLASGGLGSYLRFCIDTS